MKHYIGIDLGTSNSAICSYDGKTTRVWKSPEQNDVTPSAIFVDRRGNRYYGMRAYEMAPLNEKNAATLFKRYMGTSTRFRLENADVELTPEECSAEILRVLFSYLPEEIRTDEETATVITVPAAFNQMKKDATLEAARLAGLGRVALMQEPVAAVMSVMHTDPVDGIFVVYDLGGGTFDVSVAESIGGQVSLLAQGGKEMCGGRDWDRLIFEKIVQPWLNSHFNLPDDLAKDPAYKRLHRLCLFAVEQAKMELSRQEESCIRMDEDRLRCTDADGNEIYLDIPITREDMNRLVWPLIEDTMDVVRETLAKVGLETLDVERMVFVGGPSNYKPMRDYLSTEMGIPSGVDLNPMTAVAEGASIFAESIDWEDPHHNRKQTTREVNETPQVIFRYEARTASSSAQVAVIAQEGACVVVEITSRDSGWASGRYTVQGKEMIPLPLPFFGENRFAIHAESSDGKPIPLKDELITVHRMTATIQAIPASSSVAVKALDKLGGKPVPVYLVRENDPLPKKGTLTLKAGESLKPGSSGALQFSLWEGNIEDPIEDNRYIGTYRIPASSFDSGMIPAGADIICDYEMSDSGTLHLGVSIPCVGADFGSRSFYSRQEGQIDLSDTDSIEKDAKALEQRVGQIAQRISDPRISRLRAIASSAGNAHASAGDPESVQALYNNLLEGRRLLARLRMDHLREIRMMDLEAETSYFIMKVRQYAKPYDIERFENLERSARAAMDENRPDFDEIISQMDHLSGNVLWQQDWYVVQLFNRRIEDPSDYTDLAKFEELKRSGLNMIAEDQLGQLRAVLNSLYRLKKSKEDINHEEMFEDVNVVRG